MFTIIRKAALLVAATGVVVVATVVQANARIPYPCCSYYPGDCGIIDTHQPCPNPAGGDCENGLTCCAEKAWIC